MRRNRVFTSIVILLIFLVSCSPAQAIKPKVLFILQEDSPDMNFVLTKEVGVMAGLLEKAGFEVTYASASGKSLGSGDAAITPGLKFADVKVADYVGLVVPCMAALGDIRPSDPDENRILAEATATGKPIAAQSGGVVTLMDAGIMDGKQYATGRPDEAYMENHRNVYNLNGIFMGIGIIQDGNIITSGVCPFGELHFLGKDETTGLIQKFIEALS